MPPIHLTILVQSCLLKCHLIFFLYRPDRHVDTCPLSGQTSVSWSVFIGLTVVIDTQRPHHICNNRLHRQPSHRAVALQVATVMVAVGRIAVTNPLLHGWIHTHTHPFNGFFSGSRYQRGKTNLNFYWSSMQITTSAPHHSVFYRPDAVSAPPPTNSVKALKALCTAGYFT